MLILFDNGTPRGLARFLVGHSVEEARTRGWEELSNGELIDAAEQAGFNAMVTTDKNIRSPVVSFCAMNALPSNSLHRNWILASTYQRSMKKRRE
jgi:hypothetical protein